MSSKTSSVFSPNITSKTFKASMPVIIIDLPALEKVVVGGFSFAYSRASVITSISFIFSHYHHMLTVANIFKAWFF